MRKLFKERKLFKGGNYMRKYGRPSKPEDRSFTQPVTHCALPFCIAIEILWKR